MPASQDDRVAGFLQHLADGLVYDEGEPETDRVAGRRLQMLEACTELYRSSGVVGPDDVPLPLHRSCVHCGPCWAGKTPSPDDEPRAGISAPLNGRDYPVDGGRPRIVMVALNMVGYGGIGALWWTSHAAEREIARGRRVRFSFGCARYAAVIRSRMAGEPVPVPEDGVAHRDALRSLALVEAVKCSPEGDRSRPSDQMIARCPPWFLARELAVLEPDIVVALGSTATDAARAVTSGTLDWTDRRLVHGHGTVGDREVRLVGLHHPSWPARSRSVDALLERPVEEWLPA